VSKNEFGAPNVKPKESGKPFDDGWSDTAETPKLWVAVEGNDSMTRSRGRVSVGFESRVDSR